MTEEVLQTSDHVRTADTLVDEEPTREELLAQLAAYRSLVSEMLRDFRQVNEFLNATASYYSWCSMYEDRLAGYNRCLTVFKLQGRKNSAGDAFGHTSYKDNVQYPDRFPDGCSVYERNNVRHDWYELPDHVKQLLPPRI